MSQLASRLAQPVCGALADRHGPARVVFFGGLLLAAGTALLPLSTSVGSLTLAFCLMAVAYAAVGSTPTLFGAFATPDYWLICAGFFVCGFHVSFLLARMPGVIALAVLAALIHLPIRESRPAAPARVSSALGTQPA